VVEALLAEAARLDVAGVVEDGERVPCLRARARSSAGLEAARM
jgi:hypothetical protein